MAESFPPAPGQSEGSFPQGHELPEIAPTQSSDTLLFRRYRVIRELGRGGMGVVLLAHDTALDIPVAVKLVPDLVVKDTEAVADLRKEVLRGMALNHDAVVRTHHFEKDDSGAGIVMEFVEGDNLTDLKTRQPGGCFDPEQILPWLEQLCAVLDYAHREKRIIHRDLKPRNIMLTREGCRASAPLAGGEPRQAERLPYSAGRIKVADFGIAAVISDSMSRHSMEGKISGTLSYMSPQQAEGKRPSHLDDIHALGATIYELLTGKPPFFRGNQASIYQQIIHVVPPSLSERREELEVVSKAPLPPSWEETIAACLAKDPAERPQSAGEVLARLRSGEAVEVSRGARPSRASVGASRGDHLSRSEPSVGAAGAAAPDEDSCETQKPAPGTGVLRESAPPRRWPWAAGFAVLALAATGAYYFTTDRSAEPTPAPATDSAASAPAPVLAGGKRPLALEDFAPHMGTPAPATPPPPPVDPVATATKDSPFINSLGMEFVPVPGTNVLFCRWETRVQDYRAFADATDREVEDPIFKQPDDHPAVNVSWDDAKAFCAWLSKKEGREYRLPSDHEWSCAVGIGDREDPKVSPADKDMRVAGTWPWGAQWPPPNGAGNYAGEETSHPGKITGYHDGFTETAPVGRFLANRFGLYDLSGNVWEWCEDFWKENGTSHVVRGGSFYSLGEQSLLSSTRAYYDFSIRLDRNGFRVVVSGGTAQSTPASPPSPGPMLAAATPAPAPPAELDLVELKSGEKINGKIIRETDGDLAVSYRVAAGITDERVLAKSDIFKVTRVAGSSERSPSPPAEPVRLPVGSKVLKAPRGYPYFGPPKGYIDITGTVVTQPEWDEAWAFAAGWSPVQKGTKWGYVDTAGITVVPPKWDYALSFAGGLAAVQQGKKWGFIDSSGKLVIQAQWQNVSSFAAGLARVGQALKWGFIDSRGWVVIPPKWDFAGDFANELAPVQQGGKWGFIDPTGQLTIPLQWKFAWNFVDGLARVQQGGRYSFTDTTGKLITPFQWEDAWDFGEGLAPVRQNNKWGFIDKTGQLVLPPQWDHAASFVGGLAAVQIGGKWGFIRKTGDLAVPMEWLEPGSVYLHKPGALYLQLFKRTTPGKALAVWLGPDLKEIWRAELPLDEEK